MTKTISIAILMLTGLACGEQKKAVSPNPVSRTTGSAKTKPSAGPNDCKTDPNGANILYPEMRPFYTQGDRIDLDGWLLICKQGKWVSDLEWQAQMDSIDKPRRDLLKKALSGILGDKELADLMAYGSSIFTENGKSYRQDEVDRKFRDLLLFQSILRQNCFKQSVDTGRGEME